MLYLNPLATAAVITDGNLTLTNVVFELLLLVISVFSIIYLTLTNVVFELTSGPSILSPVAI